MERHVVVAGWGQVTQPKETENADDPLGLMVRAAKQAGETLGDPDGLRQVDGIMVVRPLSAHYSDAPGQVAERLGAAPRYRHISKIGGNSPQTLINQAAGMIARGELESILVVGAEAYVRRSGAPPKPDSALLQGIPADYPGDDITGSLPLENRHGIKDPMQGFPLFETALWNASGLALPRYLDKVGNMWAGFSRVAAGHPHAWTRQAKTAAEIITPDRSNRPIAFPYTKFMNSFITVDQGAGVILMSEQAAERYRNRELRSVYFMGGGYAEDRQRFMAQKSDFTSSPPLQAAVKKALARSGLALGDMDCFDLYSCFPCAVSIAKKMIGIGENDGRPLTITGGLGFFGGPGNNYNLHAVTTLADMIATERCRTGMVTALGWFMHKHAAGIYSCNRPRKSLATMDLEDRNDFLAGPVPVPIDDQPSGDGIIETYTIIYRSDQTPAYATLYGRTSGGNRFIANTPDDPDTFIELSKNAMVGSRVRLRYIRSDDKSMAELQG